MTTPPTTMQDSPEHTFAQKLIANAQSWRNEGEDWGAYAKRMLMGESPVGLLEEAGQCSIAGTVGWIRRLAGETDESDPR